MKHITVLTIALMLLPCRSFSQQYSKSRADLDYEGDNKVCHPLDIYLPEEIKQSYSAVIVVYGSAFLSNNLKHAAFKTLGKTLLENSFAVITVNHPSGRDSVFPAPLKFENCVAYSMQRQNFTPAATDNHRGLFTLMGTCLPKAFN